MTVVALAQVGGPPGAGEGNRAKGLAAAGRAFEDGADLVVLPELLVPGYDWDRDRVQAGAEALDGPTVSAWTELAARHGGWIAGGFAERDGERLFNTGVLVGPDGVALHYRKLHLFSGEKGVFAPGDRGLPVADTPLGRIGVCICYDLRFVETLRALALVGAQLVCVPTAWVQGFDAVRWDAEGFCPQARYAAMQANLDGVFVACASQVGEWGEHTFLGSSVLADPRGRVLVGPLPGDDDALALVEIDLAGDGGASDRGGGIRPREDRRDDVYSVVLDGRRL
ncbi:MAG TPA: nitrilase-related carbon-nitrogen hydrolase [Solirubrobacterales bacterium]|nr:nitrilase-related carbon-nitrogen hydrolase [Solirubrobacterales bacterium]